MKKKAKDELRKEIWELYLARVANPYIKEGDWNDYVKAIEQPFKPISNKPTQDILNDYKRISEADKAL